VLKHGLMNFAGKFSEKSSELPVVNSAGTTDQFTKFVIC
jgi:hypothetical protein